MVFPPQILILDIFPSIPLTVDCPQFYFSLKTPTQLCSHPYLIFNLRPFSHFFYSVFQ